MKKRRVITVLLAMSLAAACSRKEDPGIIGLFGGIESATAVRDPQKVELSTLEPDFTATGDQLVYRINSPIELPEVTYSKISDALLSPDFYDWKSGANDRIADYHLRVRFHGTRDSVDVYISFYADTIKVVRSGKPVGVERFETRSDTLFEMFHRIIPDDEHMKRLLDLRAKWKEQRRKANQPVSQRRGANAPQRG